MLARGDRLAFRLSSEVDAQAESGPTSRDSFTAVLSWEVIDTPRPGHWLVRAAFSSPALVQALTPLEQRVSQPLDEGFFLRVGADCRFEGKGYPPHWRGETRRFASTVLNTFEFAVAQTGNQWDVEQTDGIGAYTAHYEARLQPDGTTTLSREKERYRKDERATGFTFQAQLLFATASATLDRAGRWLQSARGEERVRLKAQGSILADLTQRYTLARDDAAFKAPPAVDEAKADWQDPFLMPSLVRKPPSPEVTALSQKEALERFEALYRKTAKGDAYAAALLLADWLRVHPEAAQTLLDQVRAGAIAEALRPALFLALELCGTPEARAALSAALTDRALAQMDRARASSALSDVPEPTRESAQALVTAARESDSKLIASTSVRALGHLAGRTDALSPELRSELTQTLRGELSAAKDDSRAVDVIDAIGNSADGHFVTDLGPRLVDGSPSMREHVVRALRKMPAAEVAPLLLARLGREPDPSVRAAIAETLFALGVQDLDAMTRAGQLLATEPVPEVRAALIRWLGAAAAELPIARAALVAQFRRETEPRLMQLIGQYVTAEELH